MDDPRWQPLSKLLEDVYHRYNCPIVLTETSHPAEDRPLWIDFIANECAFLLTKSIPFWGVCWYPIIDRPDWDHLHPWHQAGIWDVLIQDENMPVRSLHHPSAEALYRAQQMISLLQTSGVFNNSF